MTAGMLAAACGASRSSDGSGGSLAAGRSASSPSAVGYANCMRSHGVPDYPDPNSSGQLPKITPANEAQLGVSQSRLTAAQAACQHLWPYQAPSQAQQRQLLHDYLRFARCMRSHGVPNFPDPTIGPDGPEFVISISRDGIDPNSPQLKAKAVACERVLPAGTGLPKATVSP